MSRGVRQGCPASGFLFAMAFDPIFRLPLAPRRGHSKELSAGLDFLQPVPCAYADDFAVALDSI